MTSMLKNNAKHSATVTSCMEHLSSRVCAGRSFFDCYISPSWFRVAQNSVGMATFIDGKGLGDLPHLPIGAARKAPALVPAAHRGRQARSPPSTARTTWSNPNEPSTNAPLTKNVSMPRTPRGDAQKIAEEQSGEQRQTLLAAVRNGSVVTWQHITLHGEYDFSYEKLQDSVGLQATHMRALSLHRTGKAEMVVPLSH
jgi:hypothetical protein